MARVGRTAVHRVRALKPSRAALLSEEDEMIFVTMFQRGPVYRWLLHTSQLADRRDAEQMFERMKWQAEGFEYGYDWRTERRGWFPSDWGRASDEYLNPL
jgi:hypothetical protein